MSSFTTPLVVEHIDGRKWRLHREFTFHIGSQWSNKYIHVPVGFVTDFASVPKFVMPLLPWWAKYQKSAILHDWLYKVKYLMGNHITRKEADDVFYEAMLVEFRHHRSGEVVAWIEYKVVRLFSWLAW